jgi:penicillin-binding protein 1A
VVLAVDEASAEIGTADSLRGRIPMSELTWARAALEKQKRGPKVKTSSDVLAVGDVIAVEPVAKDGKGKAYPANSFALRQIPDVQGAIVALDPHTGRVLAMSGGYSFRLSQFNRATQARRQPGSAFKPFVYLAALDNGFSPASIVLDAPVVIKSEELGKWKPENYSKRFYGPVPMRLGLEKSRNLMTVRLAQALGVGTIARYGERFGIGENLPLELGTALGTDETTPLRLTTAYAMLVNGGKRVTPSFIDRVQDRHGKTVFQNDKRRCEWCRDVRWEEQSVPRIPDDREQVGNPQSVYQVVSMLEGVVRRGTGRRVRAVGRPIAGKTGTTNEYFDAWFLGFTPDLVAGVWVGFDQPRTLGRNETGSRAASPVFTDFMKEALAKTASVAFRVPRGIQLVRINADTGEPAAAGDKRVIVEALKPEDRLNAAGSKRAGRGAPTRRRNRSGSVVGSGTGGQY